MVGSAKDIVNRMRLVRPLEAPAIPREPADRGGAPPGRSDPREHHAPRRRGDGRPATGGVRAGVSGAHLLDGHVPFVEEVGRAFPAGLRLASKPVPREATAASGLTSQQVPCENLLAVGKAVLRRPEQGRGAPITPDRQSPGGAHMGDHLARYALIVNIAPSW